MNTRSRPPRSPGRSLWFTAFLIGLCACSPLIRVEAHVESELGALDLSLVHVRARAVCLTEQLVVPEPGFAAGPAVDDAGTDVADAGDAALDAGPDAAAPRRDDTLVLDRGVAIDEDGNLSYSISSDSCTTAITVWYDVTADGEVNAGDYVGSLGPALVEDRSLCDNLNDLGSLRLEKVP